MRRLSMSAVAMTVTALSLAGCSFGSTGPGDDGGGGASLTITSPQDGATVSAPFMLKWNSTVALGPPSSGKDHVHVYVDGQESDYTVVGGTQFKIANLSPGQHELDIALQHADHTPVGPEDSINVSVSGSGSSSGSGSGSGSDSSNGSGNGGYSY